MKKNLAAIIALALGLALLLTGCRKVSSSILEADTSDTKRVVITAENAESGSSVMSGVMEVSDEETVIIEGTLDKGGVIDVGVIPEDILGEQATIEDIENISIDDTAVLRAMIKMTDSAEGTMPAGKYYVIASVTETATGTVTVRCEARDPGLANPWKEAASADEAAKAAGLDMFEIPEGSNISLGEIKPSAYRYMNDLLEIEINFPAVDMYIRKGLAELGDDISGDYNSYANTWIQNIKGLEVTCFGNRSGEATKTIWTMGDYSYAILAYGRGGDDDYGISPDDINALINGMQ